VSILFLTLPFRDIQERINSSESNSSLYHKSHSETFTDVKVYPPLRYSANSEDPDAKKRKRAVEADGIIAASNDVRYTEHVKANNHLLAVHGEIKTECEELASLCVCTLFFRCCFADCVQEKLRLWVNLTMPKCVPISTLWHYANIFIELKSEICCY
jgi:proteasome activator subunit 3 (PA28 gamma)